MSMRLNLRGVSVAISGGFRRVSGGFRGFRTTSGSIRKKLIHVSFIEFANFIGNHCKQQQEYQNGLRKGLQNEKGFQRHRRPPIYY